MAKAKGSIDSKTVEKRLIESAGWNREELFEHHYVGDIESVVVIVGRRHIGDIIPIFLVRVISCLVFDVGARSADAARLDDDEHEEYGYYYPYYFQNFRVKLLKIFPISRYFHYFCIKILRNGPIIAHQTTYRTRI